MRGGVVGYVRWTSCSDGRLSRNRLRVRLFRCAGPDMLPSPNMANELLCGGEDDVEEADDERGDEQSSDADRLRLSVIVRVM